MTEVEVKVAGTDVVKAVAEEAPRPAAPEKEVVEPHASTSAPETAEEEARGEGAKDGGNNDKTADKEQAGADAGDEPATKKRRGLAFEAESENYQGTIRGAGWTRSPIHACSPEDFAWDFFRFLEEKGEDWELAGVVPGRVPCLPLARVPRLSSTRSVVKQCL